MGSNPITLKEAGMQIVNNLSYVLNHIDMWALLLLGSLHWMYMQDGKHPQSYSDF